MSIKRNLTRVVTVSAVVATLGLLTTGVASAHVTANIYGEPPEQGGYTAITFRVPNEADDADTNKLTVHFAEEYGFGKIRTKPVPGWTSKVTTTKLDKPIVTDDGAELAEVVTSVTWTADKDAVISGSEYQEFPISAGPLPTDTDTLVLPADQHYTNGDVVKWAEEGEEAEKPAPVVALAPASEDGHHGGGSPSAAYESDLHLEASSSTDDTARWLGGIGIGIGGLASGLALGSVLRNRKKTTS